MVRGVSGMKETPKAADRLGTFPFGEPLRAVVQRDQTPKDVFVLGVYASAVHARWRDAAGRTVVRALAVASEPFIFWDGAGAEEIVGRIPIPREAGSLVPADDPLNGPSGRALDDLFLKPLDLDRSRAWLCDLVPHCCANSRQTRAIEERYLPIARRLDLPEPSLPPVPKVFADDARRLEILDELRRSQAKTLITLGDQPLRWFVSHWEPRWKRLSDFGTKPEDYGRRHRVRLDDLEVDLLPLAHPRQASRLGRYSQRWLELHEGWVERTQSNFER